MKILVADDHELFLKGLELILHDFDPAVELVFAKNYLEVFDAISEQRDFSLVLTDLAMPGAKWLDAIRKIHEILPDTPIIILSAVFDKEIVQKTIELGAAGYIPKTSSNAVIISAVNLVLSGESVYIPPELPVNKPRKMTLICSKMWRPFLRRKRLRKKPATCLPVRLTSCGLSLQGKSNKQIAYELGLTEGTVKLHVTAILKILNVYNRTGAVVEATHLGIIKEHG
ncbi:MAG: response regulator [Alphaproteobacteria bacterium]